MCGCAEMPKFFQLGSAHFKPPTSWEIVGTSEEHYARFLRCRECSTQWFVEEQIERGEVTFCIRLDPDESPENFDPTPVQASHLRLKRGGHSERKCLWQGCQKKALRKLYFCEEHGVRHLGLRE